MTNVFTLIIINRITKEQTTICDNEYIDIIQMKKRNINQDEYEIKIINQLTNKEHKPNTINKRENNKNRNYKTNTKVLRNNYIKLY